MIFDSQNGGFVAAGLFAFPDWVYPDLPKQSSQIIETGEAQGTMGGVAISITGTVDD